MKISIHKKSNKKIDAFQDKEWENADTKHYGKSSEWETEVFILKATDGNEIVGTLKFKVEVGVAYIETLLVAKHKQRQGIGKMLMQKAEEIAKSKSAHKIHLVTGKGWNSVTFYTSLGYSVSHEMPNHYLHRSWYEMTKFI